VIGCFCALFALINKGEFHCTLNILDLCTLMKDQPRSLLILADAIIRR